MLRHFESEAMTRRRSRVTNHTFVPLEEFPSLEKDIPIYPTLPANMTVNQAIAVLLFRKPEMLRIVYQKATEGKRTGHLEILPGIVKELVDRGFLPVKKGDSRFFSERSRTCETARAIAEALRTH